MHLMMMDDDVNTGGSCHLLDCDIIDCNKESSSSTSYDEMYRSYSSYDVVYER
jgi:hypothetical protein